MKLTEKNKEQIDAMSYREMLARWRFAPLGDKTFQGETGEYFAKVMKEKRRALDSEDPESHSKISKSIGW